MNLELIGRIHKELSITGGAVYEAVLAVSERVNRKVQIIRLHWHASMLLQQMEQHEGELGQEVVDQVARRFLTTHPPESAHAGLEAALARTAVRVQELKHAHLQVDAQIRELKLETIHEDLLRLQRDLTLRSAGIERLTVTRRAAAAGQPVSAMPRHTSVHIATVMRGPFLLSPSDDLVFRPDDIVLLVGHQADLDECVIWFTSQRPVKALTTKSA